MSLTTRKWFGTIGTVFAVLLLGLIGIPSAQAQVETGPGVARVSVIHGDVSMQRGDTGDWSVASLNTPLVTGDSIATGDASRTEVQLDYANVIRLDDHSQAHIATLTRDAIQVQVAQGLVDYAVLRNDSQAQIEIDTPNVAVHPTRKGIYRIEVDSDGQTRVIIRDGEANISTPQGSTEVHRGQLITVRGTGNDEEYQIADAPSNDDWDSWNRQRDNTILDARAWRYTNGYYTGSSDLDAYGVWSEVPSVGPVWIPRVSVGWAPYRAGRWVWEPYYGWTWVSYEPWGWAPYHYGRWFIYGGSWAWWPGPVYPTYYPVWAPAYVSFFGFGYGGAGFSFGVGFGGGFGSIGWLPLGPCDYYHPWYGAYRDRFTLVNVNNINFYNGRRGRGFDPLLHGDRYSNFREMMVNDRLRRGFSSVPSDRFGRGRFQARPVSYAELRRARVMTGNLPVVPTRESLRATNRAPAFRPSSRTAGQRFFMNRTPAARPESFTRQASRLREAINRSGGVRGMEVRGNGMNQQRGRGTPSRNGFSERGFTPSNSREQNRGPQSSGRADRVPFSQSHPSANRPGSRMNQPPAAGRNQAQPQGGWRHFSGQPGGPANQPRPSDRIRNPGNASRSPAQNRGRSQAPAAQPRPPARFDGRQQGSGSRQFSGRPNQPANRAQPSQDRSRPQASRSPQGRAQNAGQGGWQRFSGRSNGPANQAQPSQNRGRPQVDRSPQGRAQNAGQNGWRSFSRQGTPSHATPSPQTRGTSQRGQNRYRQPLNLNEPIVRRRSSGHRFDGTSGGRSIGSYSYRGGNSGGNRSVPAYRGGANPNYRPSPAYRGGSYGASRAAPNYRGGSYRNHSGPSPSYRGRSTGGGYRPAGGFHGAPSYRGGSSSRGRGGASSRGSNHGGGGGRRR